MSQDYNPFQATRDCLQVAKNKIYNAMSMLSASKTHKAYLPSEQKLLAKARVDPSEALDKVKTLISAQDIYLKNKEKTE